MRSLGSFQLTHNPLLSSIDGFSGLQQGQVSNLYINHNPRLCYILGEYSDRDYWSVSNYKNSTFHVLN